MDVLHPHHRNVPEEKDDEGKKKTGEYQQPNEDALLRPDLQNAPQDYPL